MGKPIPPAYGPAAAGLEDFFPQAPSASASSGQFSPPPYAGTNQLTRRMRVQAKRFGSGESHITLDATLEPLYFLARPISPTKPLVELHRGRDANGPVVGWARHDPMGFGMDVQYGNSKSNAEYWIQMRGRANDWSGLQHFDLQGRNFIWRHAVEVEGVRAQSRAGFLVMQDATSGEVCALWERKSVNRKGDHGMLMLREGLGDEAEVLTVVTALVWEDGKAALKASGGRCLAGGAGLGMMGGMGMGMGMGGMI